MSIPLQVSVQVVYGARGKTLQISRTNAQLLQRLEVREGCCDSHTCGINVSKKDSLYV